MTNYKEIETYLKHGIHVSVKDDEGKYLAISPVKDKRERYRTSYCYHTLEEAKQNIGEDYGLDDLEESCKDWIEITPFHLDFEPYPVGMKVRVIRTEEVREIVDTKFKGIYILKDYPLIRYSHTELIPYFEEESLSGQEVSVTIGDKTYKAIIK